MSRKSDSPKPGADTQSHGTKKPRNPLPESGLYRESGKLLAGPVGDKTPEDKRKGKRRHDEDTPPPELDMSVVPAPSEEIQAAQQTFIATFLEYCNIPSRELDIKARKLKAKVRLNYTKLQGGYVNELKDKLTTFPGGNDAGKRALKQALQRAEFYLEESGEKRIPVFDGTNDDLVAKKLEKLSPSNVTRAPLYTNIRNALIDLQKLQHQKRDEENTSITYAEISAAIERYRVALQKTERPNQKKKGTAQMGEGDARGDTDEETPEEGGSKDKGKGPSRAGSRSHGTDTGKTTSDKDKGKGKRLHEDTPPPEPDMSVVPEQSQKLKDAQQTFITTFLQYCDVPSGDINLKGRNLKAKVKKDYVEPLNHYIKKLKDKLTTFPGENEAGKRALELALQRAEFYLEESGAKRIPVFDGTNDKLVAKKFEKLAVTKSSSVVFTNVGNALTELQNLQHQKRDEENTSITYAEISAAIEKYRAALKKATYSTKGGGTSSRDIGEGSSKQQ